MDLILLNCSICTDHMLIDSSSNSSQFRSRSFFSLVSLSKIKQTLFHYRNICALLKSNNKMNSKETEKFYWNIIKETLIKIIIVDECRFPSRCNEFQIFQVEIKTNNRNCYYLYYFRYNLTMIILITFGVIRTCVVTKKKPKQCSNLILQRSLAFGDSITMNKFLHVRTDYILKNFPQRRR